MGHTVCLRFEALMAAMGQCCHIYIYIYVCMYVCMYVCRYVCKHKPGRDLFVLYDFGAALAG